MKSKLNYLVLFMIFFFPFIVNADDKDIQIKSVELVEKTGKAQELKEAKYEDLKLWFNLKFFEVNDSAKYKIVVKNVSDDEYSFNTTNQVFSKEKYISYNFMFDEQVDSLKSGEENVMYVTISYDLEVESDDYVENLYANDNYMNLSFDKVSVKEEIKEEVKNPETSVSMIVITSLIVCAISFVLLVISLKNKNMLYGILAFMLLIPTLSRAAELFKIDINAHIEIPKMGKFVLCSNITDNEDVLPEFDFEVGMTFEDWINSEYNVPNEVYPSGFARDDIWKINENPNIQGDFFHGKHGGFSFKLYPEQIGGSTKDDYIIENAKYHCTFLGAECVSPYSKVMISLSGNTKLAKDIKENDDVVYYDFVDKKMKVGKVKKSYVHKGATQFIRYTLEDGSYLEATDYHPIYTLDGWKSYTNRNGYETPVVGDRVKTNEGYIKITKIETYTGKEDFVDFKVVSKDGVIVDNYYANGMLVHSAY